MNIKKTLKIITGVIIFFTLPSLLLFGFVYFKYNEELPTGISGTEADNLAYKMLDALNYNTYKNAKKIEWTFKKRHHYEWDKETNICNVYWKDFKVTLNLKDHTKNKAFVHSFGVEGSLANDLINKAIKYYNNDSFWLVAPYKVFDKGTIRKLVKLDHKKNALLITYTSGGSTPGDSYLWHLNEKGKPTSFQMWVDILPIGGLEATWNDWITTETGVNLPTFHKFLLFGLEITDIKTSN